MAGDGLTAVERYLDELRAALGQRRTADRIAAEVEGHLTDAIEHRMRGGLDRDAAITDALAAFGSAGDLAAGFDHDAMPTRFTRWSGLAGILGAVAVVLIPLEAAARATPPSGRDPLLLSGFVALALLVVGFLGVVARSRGAFGRRRGALAILLLAIPIAMASMGYGWGLIGVPMAVMALGGLALVLDTAFQVGALPRPATLLFAAAGLGLAALSPTDVEKESLPYYVGFALLMIGWVWLQYTLWSERSEHSERRAPSV